LFYKGKFLILYNTAYKIYNTIEGGNMKRILLVLLLISFMSPLCFAKQKPKETAKPVEKALETKNVSGKIESVLIGVPVKRIRSKIIVLNASGEKLEIDVKTSTPVSAKDGKAITLKEVKKDDTVEVVYLTNPQGMHRAVSIKVVGP